MDKLSAPYLDLCSQQQYCMKHHQPYQIFQIFHLLTNFTKLRKLQQISNAK